MEELTSLVETKEIEGDDESAILENDDDDDDEVEVEEEEEDKDDFVI